MKIASASARPVIVPLLVVFAVQVVLSPFFSLAAIAQWQRGSTYTTQPYVPGRPVFGSPAYNPGLINRGTGLAPAYAPYYSVPQATAAGNYLINANQFWRSESGYYYPWVNNSAYGQIIYAPQVNQAPTAQVPPLSTVFADLLNYLDQKKAQGVISLSDYQHLRRRATDLQTKYFSLRTAAEGSIDERDEAQIRRDLDELGAEVAKSVKT
ncbi:MAG: hypothetical protein P4L53_00130 [Candidatus Obscuribacterales bacterium]|nr:hypothetical protein [Candidatus Obscuribacterales bacterium]